MELGPQVWGARYALGSIPWDLGRPHPELQRMLEEDPSLGLGRPGKVLVPGAGRGWDALAFAEAGWETVAVDFAEGLAAQALPALAGAGAEYREADAFEIDERFDLVFDHTFLVAVPFEVRPRVGDLARRVLAPPGRFVSLVFPIGKPPSLGGPPFGITVPEVDAVLGPGFERIEDRAALPARRSYEERLGVWVRV